jgi:hypothetical protein
VSTAGSPTGATGTVSTGRSTIWLLAGVVGPAILLVGVVLAGLTWSAHDHRVHNISDLGGIEAPYPVVLNVSFAAVGALLVTFAAALRRPVSRDLVPVTGLGTGLIATFGVSLIVQVLTPCTPGVRAGPPSTWPTQPQPSSASSPSQRRP